MVDVCPPRTRRHPVSTGSLLPTVAVGMNKLPPQSTESVRCLRDAAKWLAVYICDVETEQ